MTTLKITVQNAPTETFNCDELIVAKITNGQLQNRNDVLDYSVFNEEEKQKIEDAFNIIQSKLTPIVPE
ncbi:MAG: hypothetical protein ACT4ON_15940 [Bacteroidota bacterium]